MNFKTILANVYGDSYFCHQVVESAFPEQKKAFYQKDDTLVVYSEKGPLTSFANEVYILETCEFNIDELLRTLTKMFSLQVNPIRRVNGKYTKVHNDELEEWLTRKFEEVGCSLKNFIVARSGWDVFNKPNNTNQVSLYCREINGILEISNPELFKEKYFAGIGQGKAFGYGLIQLLN